MKLMLGLEGRPKCFSQQMPLSHPFRESLRPPAKCKCLNRSCNDIEYPICKQQI